MKTNPKVLLTGASGFTGKHLIRYLKRKEYKVYSLNSDLTHREAIFSEVSNINPDYVIHLGGISFAGPSNNDAIIFEVNVNGTRNLLDALKITSKNLKRVILASSAAVYGNSKQKILKESFSPNPVNPYGKSKLEMENMALSYTKELPILIVRPFNYTGVGHDINFVVPKIVSAYKLKKTKIELGNIEVFREFNDVRDVCIIYQKLLEAPLACNKLNICSGRLLSLKNIIETMDKMSGIKMEVNKNKEFVRADEIPQLSGDSLHLNNTIDHIWKYSIEDTLSWMLYNNYE